MHFSQGKDGLRLEIPLNEIVIAAKDYLIGIIETFDDLWEKYPEYIATWERNLRESMSEVEAKKVAIDIFNIKVKIESFNNIQNHFHA